MSVWAAFGPYKTADAAVKGLARASRAVFNSEEWDQQQRWIRGHVENFYRSQLAGTFPSFEGIMRSALIKSARGTAFNEAYKRAKQEQITEMEGAVARLNEVQLGSGYKLDTVPNEHGGVSVQYKQIWSDEDIAKKDGKDAVKAFTRIGERLMADKSAEANELREFLVRVNRFHTGADPQSAEHFGVVWGVCTVGARDKSDEKFSEAFTALNDAWIATLSGGKTNS